MQWRTRTAFSADFQKRIQEAKWIPLPQGIHRRSKRGNHKNLGSSGLSAQFSTLQPARQEKYCNTFLGEPTEQHKQTSSALSPGQNLLEGSGGEDYNPKSEQSFVLWLHWDIVVLQLVQHPGEGIWSMHQKQLLNYSSQLEEILFQWFALQECQ